MKNSIIELTNKLISIPSTTESPQLLSEVLNVAKKGLENYSVEKFSKDGIPSLLFYNTKSRPKKFKVILDAHFDVVPGKDYQYKPYEKDGKLYGRGAFDMKAAAAVEVLVFKEIANKLKYPVALQLVTDEEVGGFKGAKYQLQKGVKTDFIIAGEGTNFGVNNKSKGIIWAKVKTKGKTGHGAYLWNGDNAIWKMKKFIDNIEKAFPVPKKEEWRTSLNLAKIETTNQTFNKIPDDCIASIDIRYIPEDAKTIQKKLKKLVPAGAEIDIMEYEPSHFTAENDFYVNKLRQATKKVTGKLPPVISKHGASDVRHYTDAGMAGVTFGPVGVGLHTDNEWVDIKSLDEYYQILKHFLLCL